MAACQTSYKGQKACARHAVCTKEYVRITGRHRQHVASSRYQHKRSQLWQVAWQKMRPCQAVCEINQNRKVCVSAKKAGKHKELEQKAVVRKVTRIELS